MGSEKLSDPERQVLAAQIGYYREKLAEGIQGGQTAIVQEYLHDSNNLQWRTALAANGGAEWKGTGKTGRVPEVEPSGRDWGSELLGCQVVSAGEATGHAVREWAGTVHSGYFKGVITSATAKNLGEREYAVPPLASGGPRWNQKAHIIDEFFWGSEAQFRIVGHAKIDGMETTVVDRVWPREGGFNAARAFLDVQRGCLPLRVEWYLGDITPYAGNVAPSEPNRVPIPYRVIRDVRVIEASPGYFYPMSGLVEDYAAKVGSTREKLRFAVSGISQWDVESVVANEPIAREVFALEFPMNTLVFDARTSDRFLTGAADAHLKRVIGEIPPGPYVDQRTNPLKTIILTLGCALALGMASYVWFRRGRA